MQRLLCDRRMPVKLKIYKSVVRPAMLYEIEAWTSINRQEV